MGYFVFGVLEEKELWVGLLLGDFGFLEGDVEGFSFFLYSKVFGYGFILFV